MKKFFSILFAVVLMAITQAPVALAQMIKPILGPEFPSTENLAQGNASDDARLAAIIGSDVYGNVYQGLSFYAANGKVTVTDNGSTSASLDIATLYVGDDRYIYTTENGGGVAFIIKNGAISRVTFKKDIPVYDARKRYIFTESELVALMGEKVFVGTVGENNSATISVVNDKVCITANGNTVELSSNSNQVYKENGLYVFADESEYFIFSKVNRTIGEIEYRKEINGQTDFVYFSAIANEADIAAVLNGKIFALIQSQEEVSFYAEGNQLVLYVDGVKQDMKSFKMFDYGDSFEISNNESGIYLYLDYSNNKVNRVSFENEHLYKEMSDVTLEGELASLIGENEYLCFSKGVKLFVDNDHIAMGQENGISYLVTDCILVKDGNNYVFKNNHGVTFTFFVENGQVTTVEAQTPEESFPFYLLADEKELVALMGSNEYFSTGAPGSIKVHEGNVCYTYDNRGQQVREALNIDCSLVKIDGNYKFILSFANQSFTFVVVNDKVTKIVYDSPIMSYVYVNLSQMTTVSEAALVALMGDNKYVNRDGESISVVNNHVYYEFGQGSRNLVEGSNLYKVDGNYVLMDAANYVFVVKNGQVARIDCYDNEGITTFAIPADLSDLTALIGSNTYVYISRQIQKSISLDQIGNIILSNNGQTSHLNNGFFLYRDGDNYVFQNIPVSFTFIVENGQVTRIEYVDPENQFSLLKVASEAELIPLMGQNVYAGGLISITVKDNHIVLESPQMQMEILMVNSYGAPLKDGDNYIFTDGSEIFTFVVENGQVIMIVNDGYMPFTLYPTADKAELVALIGNDEYVNDEYDKKICSSNGNVVLLYNGDMEDVFNEYGLLLKAGDNYVYDGSYYVFTFIVENGKLTRIDYADMMNENYSYINKMTTAIKKVNTTNEKAVKAIKTIKNGRIVIIKGNETYDLSGRRM